MTRGLHFARKVAAALLGLVILLSVAPPAAAAPAQIRALWVDAFGEGLYDPGQIDALVAQARAMNVNAILAQVVRRGDCFCNRSIAPRTEEKIAPLPFDPLETLIARAHAEGIEVHAWIITTAVWKGKSPPADPAHPFNVHGPNASGPAFWLTRRVDGREEQDDGWMLDPGHPEVQDWIAGLATSIARSYDVDGINLDRIRYPDGNVAANVPSWGYNPTALAIFQASAGRRDVPDPRDAQWTQWRRDQVTAIVRRVYAEVTALKPGIRVSADTIAYGPGPAEQGGWERTRTYAEVLQDWRAWLGEGILDTAFLMNYKRDAAASDRAMYAGWADFAKDSALRGRMVIGSALYLNDVDGSVRQIREALAPNAAGNVAAGWAGYSYRTPDTLSDAKRRTGAASRAERARAVAPVFEVAAPMPAMPWKASPPRAQTEARGARAEPPVRRERPACGIWCARFPTD